PPALRGANFRSTMRWFAAVFGSRLNFATPRIFSYAPESPKFMPEAKDERSRTSIPITSACAATSAESPTAANPNNTRLLKIPTPADRFSGTRQYIGVASSQLGGSRRPKGHPHLTYSGVL